MTRGIKKSEYQVQIFFGRPFKLPALIPHHKFVDMKHQNLLPGWRVPNPGFAIFLSAEDSEKPKLTFLS